MIVTSRPAPAAALVEGDCEVSLAGQALRGLSTRDVDDAIAVDYAEEVVIEGRTAGSGGRHRVTGQVAGVGITLAEGESDNRSWSQVVDVDEYANYSLGLHRVEVEAPGCSAAALVRVEGRPPLWSRAGAVAAACATLGLMSVVLAWTRGRRPGRVRTRSYRVSDPFDHLDELRTAADYVGWAEVLGDRQGRALVEDAPANPAILERLRADGVQARLETLREAGVKRFPMFSVGDPLTAAAVLLPRIRWRPRIPVIGTLLAAVGGPAVIIVLQQLSVHYPRGRELGMAALAGGVLPVGVSMVARTVGVRRSNRALNRAEEALLGEDAKPLYPPFEQSDVSWKPTHVVPAGGLSAWGSPDPTKESIAHLDARLPVEVVQQAGEWAWVLCSNGWTGWVDARQLVAIGDGGDTGGDDVSDP